MARTMYLSERTAKRKIQDILAKLGATSRAHAVAEAFKRGLL
jgi:DNA-binding NarL/FixJ family response regulator